MSQCMANFQFSPIFDGGHFVLSQIKDFPGVNFGKLLVTVSYKGDSDEHKIT